MQRRLMIAESTGGMVMPRIYMQNFHVDRINDVSGMFHGVNHPCYWRHSRKVNSGFGDVTGNFNHVNQTAHVVNDRDFIDQWVVWSEKQGEGNRKGEAEPKP
jgi:hypothetical protein